MNKNIYSAINIENIYISNKLQGNPVTPLLYEIQNLGFESLEEYFKEKRDYLFKQLHFEIIEKSPTECLTEGWRMINERVTGAFFMETPDTIVYVNKTKPYNKKYCQENNLTVYELPTGGGTIISGAGDLAVDICIPNEIGIDTNFMLTGIAKILSKYMSNVKIVDNDILVNDGKVCGMTYFNKNRMTLFVMHFSFSDNSELIDKICHQDDKSVKHPSYMTGLDKYVLKNEVIEWLQST